MFITDVCQLAVLVLDIASCEWNFSKGMLGEYYCWDMDIYYCVVCYWCCLLCTIENILLGLQC